MDFKRGIIFITYCLQVSIWTSMLTLVIMNISSNTRSTWLVSELVSKLYIAHFMGGYNFSQIY